MCPNMCPKLCPRMCPKMRQTGTQNGAQNVTPKGTWTCGKLCPKINSKHCIERKHIAYQVGKWAGSVRAPLMTEPALLVASITMRHAIKSGACSKEQAPSRITCSIPWGTPLPHNFRHLVPFCSEQTVPGRAPFFFVSIFLNFAYSDYRGSRSRIVHFLILCPQGASFWSSILLLKASL